MKDLSVLLEVILLLCLPLVPAAVGVLLRRRFTPAAPAEGAEAAPLTGAQKAGRLAGSLLIWTGVLSALFVVALLFHYKGKFM